MKNEAAFKVHFRKSVTKHKGFSLALAAPMISGIPDMYIIMPGHIPILIEAKWLGTIKKRDFRRKVQFTPLQALWLGECHKITPYSAMGLVGLIYNDKLHAVLVAHGTEQFQTMTHDFQDQCAFLSVDKEKDYFNIPELFQKVPIPRIATGEGNKDVTTELRMAV